jgi:hypothetical protein
VVVLEKGLSKNLMNLKDVGDEIEMGAVDDVGAVGNDGT